MIAKWIDGGIKLANIWNLSVSMHRGMFHIQTEKVTDLNSRKLTKWDATPLYFLLSPTALQNLRKISWISDKKRKHLNAHIFALNHC